MIGVKTALRDTRNADIENYLAALQRICLIPCEEYEDLKKAVADYRARAAR